MTKKTLTLILILTAARAFACGGYGDLYPKWSLGVIGYGNFSMPVAGTHGYFLPGIQFSHATPSGRWAQRVAIEHMKQSFTTPVPPGGADMLSEEGYENSWLLRVGLERGWFLHRLFRPYVAVDLAGQLMRSDITYSGGIAGLNQRDEIRRKGFGLMPAVGFKTFIGKRISIYAEYRAEAMLYDVDKKITYYNGYTDSRPYGEMEATFRAGRLFHGGIQVMF